MEGREEGREGGVEVAHVPSTASRKPTVKRLVHIPGVVEANLERSKRNKEGSDTKSSTILCDAGAFHRNNGSPSQLQVPGTGKETKTRWGEAVSLYGVSTCRKVDVTGKKK